LRRRTAWCIQDRGRDALHLVACREYLDLHLIDHPVMREEIGVLAVAFDLAHGDAAHADLLQPPLGVCEGESRNDRYHQCEFQGFLRNDSIASVRTVTTDAGRTSMAR